MVHSLRVMDQAFTLHGFSSLFHSRFSVHDSWLMVHGSWFKAYNSVHGKVHALLFSSLFII